MYVSSTIRVAGDRLMEGIEEISIERKKDEEGELRMITWRNIVEDPQEVSVDETATGDLYMEEDQEEQEETERWERAREYTTTLDNNRDGGLTRYCYKRIRPVVFDLAGEFVNWSENRLSWTN